MYCSSSLMFSMMTSHQGQTETHWMKLKLGLFCGPTSRVDEEFWEADDEDEDHKDEEFGDLCSCHVSTM